MSEADYSALPKSYQERWHQEDIHPDVLNEEIKKQIHNLTTLEIVGPGGMISAVREIDRTHACKRLCVILSHPKTVEAHSRQQIISQQPVIDMLIVQMCDGSDLVRYWAGLTVVQLVLRNSASARKCLKSKIVDLLAELLVLAEEQRIKVENGGPPAPSTVASVSGVMAKTTRTRAEKKALGIELDLVTERVQVVCLQILVNLVHACQDTVTYISKTDNGGKKGVVYACSAIAKRGLKLAVPLLVSMMMLLKELSQMEELRMAMIRTDLWKWLKQHVRDDKVECVGSVSKNVREMLLNYAAVKIQKHVRGHQNRIRHTVNSRELTKQRLEGFTSRFTQQWAFRAVRRNADVMIKMRNFMGLRALKSSGFPTALGFDAMVTYKELSKKLAGKAEKMRNSTRAARNHCFFLWIEYLDTEVAELHAEVEKKCGNVLTLMTGEMVKRCFVEWKAFLRKSKAIKRRWLHGALDTGWRAWRKMMEQMYALHEEVKEKCGRVTALIAGDFLRLTFKDWHALIVKKKVATRRFMHRTLYFGWMLWLEFVEEATELKAAVFAKCSNVLSLLATDKFTLAFDQWRRYVFLRLSTVGMREKLRLRMMEDMWAEWMVLVDETHKIMEMVRSRCSRVVAYIAGGYEIECFKEWRDLTAKNKKAMFKWQNGALVKSWAAWVNEYLPDQRIVRNCRKRMDQRQSRGWLLTWREKSEDKKYLRELCRDIAFMMMHISFTKPFRSWMEYTENSKREKLIYSRVSRRFKMRSVRVMYIIWAKWASTSAYQRANLGVLVNRIKNRTLLMFFDMLSRILEENLLNLKQALLSKSDLLKRWLMRPAITTLDIWVDHTNEEKHKRALLARLKYRIQNHCVVWSLAKWKQAIEVFQEERNFMLAQGVRDAVHNGDVDQLRVALSWHPVWRIAYKKDGKEILRQVLADTLQTASKLPKLHKSHMPDAVSTQHKARPAPAIGRSVDADTLLLHLEHVDAARRAQLLQHLADTTDKWAYPLLPPSPAKPRVFPSARTTPFSPASSTLPSRQNSQAPSRIHSARGARKGNAALKIISEVRGLCESDRDDGVKAVSKAVLQRVEHFRAAAKEAERNGEWLVRDRYWDRVLYPMDTLATARETMYSRAGRRNRAQANSPEETPQPVVRSASAMEFRSGSSGS